MSLRLALYQERKAWRPGDVFRATLEVSIRWCWSFGEKQIFSMGIEISSRLVFLLCIFLWLARA